MAPSAGWRSLGGFGLILAIIGLGQLALYFFPTLAFGSPEWEYGASAQVLGALPLPTIGLAAVLASALALGSRWQMVVLAIVLLIGAILIFAVLGLFWTVAPMALKATPDAIAGPIQQTIARTTLSGVGFGALYILMAVRAIRQLRRSPRRSIDA